MVGVTASVPVTVKTALLAQIVDPSAGPPTRVVVGLLDCVTFPAALTVVLIPAESIAVTVAVYTSGVAAVFAGSVSVLLKAPPPVVDSVMGS